MRIIVCVCVCVCVCVRKRSSVCVCVCVGKVTAVWLGPLSARPKDCEIRNETLHHREAIQPDASSSLVIVCLLDLFQKLYCDGLCRLWEPACILEEGHTVSLNISGKIAEA